MRGVLRLGRIAQDRSGQAVRLVEVLVGQPDEGGVAETRARGHVPVQRSANSTASDDRFTMT